MTLYMDRAFSPQYLSICMLKSMTINPFANSLKKLGIPLIIIFLMPVSHFSGLAGLRPFFFERKWVPPTITCMVIPITEARAAPPIPI